MKKFLAAGISITVFVALTIGLSACSSNEVADNENPNPDATAAPAADASTDSVPQPTAENPAPPTAEAQKDAAAVTPPDTGNAAPVAQPTQEAQSAPAAQPAETTPAAAPVASNSGGSDSYTVQEGDTLMKIAFENYGDLYKWKDIYEANKDQIPNPVSLKKGTVLKLDKPASAPAISRNGDPYVIKQGDTLGTISNDVYGTPKKWKKIWKNNHELIKNPNQIFAGFTLYYTMSPEDKADFERFKKEVAPQPMADSGDSARTPSSVTPPAGDTAQPAQVTQPAPAQAQPAPAQPQVGTGTGTTGAVQGATPPQGN